MLANLAKLLIKYYWNKYPENKRKVCIHKISCSNAVYQELNKNGFYQGVITYLERRRTCNRNYKLFLVDEKVIIKTKNNKIIQEDNINPIIVRDYKTKFL